MRRTAEQRFVQHVCLRNPLPSIQVPESGSALSHVCIMVASCSSLRCSCTKQTSLMQRSRGFGHGVVVSKICYNAVIVLWVVLCDCCKPMSNCGHWAFSNSRFEVGLSAFQLPMLAKCDALPKEDLLDMFVSGIHSRHSFLELQVSTPYQKLQVPESGSTLHHLCINFWLHHAHPFVATVEKNLSHAETQRVWSRSWGLQDLLQCSDCALNCAI